MVDGLGKFYRRRFAKVEKLDYFESMRASNFAIGFLFVVNIALIIGALFLYSLIMELQKETKLYAYSNDQIEEIGAQNELLSKRMDDFQANRTSISPNIESLSTRIALIETSELERKGILKI